MPTILQNQQQMTIGALLHTIVMGTASFLGYVLSTLGDFERNLCPRTRRPIICLFIG